MLPPATTTADFACGCKLTVTFPKVQEGGMVFLADKDFMTINLDYCAMHKAAGEMLDMAKELASQCWCGCRHEACRNCRRYKQAADLIAKATKK